MKTALLTLLLAVLAATASAAPYTGKAFPRKQFEAYLANGTGLKLVGCREADNAYTCFGQLVAPSAESERWKVFSYRLFRLDNDQLVIDTEMRGSLLLQETAP